MITKDEKIKFEIIEKVIQKDKTIKEAQLDLNLSRQQIYRLMDVYRNYGEDGFIHKGRGKTSHRKLNPEIIEQIKQLYLEEYFDYNLQAFYEVLKDEYNFDISYDTILRHFKSDDIISPLAHKNTIKLYDNRMKNAIDENIEIKEQMIDLYKTRQIEFKKAHTRRSNNLYSFGQEIQMDACEKIWFGNIVSYLHLAVDKGTKKILFGWFEYEEITRGYFVILFNIICNYGIPEKIKTDNRNSFSSNKNQVDTTQFGRICNDLGIKLVTTSVPTGKPNVERMNKTVKDRLIAEFRHLDISTIDDANKYLNNTFIPKMNRKFSYQIDDFTSKMRVNNYSDYELKLIISERYKRIIDNASSIKYNNIYYIPVDPITGEMICFSKSTECMFLITYDADYWCLIEDKYYQLVELKDRSTIMKKEQDNMIQKQPTKYIPPSNHPWRKKLL